MRWHNQKYRGEYEIGKLPGTHFVIMAQTRDQIKASVNTNKYILLQIMLNVVGEEGRDDKAEDDGHNNYDD